MGQSVDVVVSELHAAAARLKDVGQRLQDGLSSVDLDVDQLMGSGWRGGAATAYDKAWDQWHGGAGQVVRGLQTMSQLLTVAGREYAKTDEQGAEAVGSQMQTTGDPGGSGSGTGGTAAGQSAGGSPSGSDGSTGSTAGSSTGAPIETSRPRSQSAPGELPGH